MTAPRDFRIAIVAPCPRPHVVHEGWMSRISSIDGQLEGLTRIYLNFSEAHDDSRRNVVRYDAERAEVFLNPTGKNSVAFVSDLAENVDAFYVHTLHLAEHVLPWLKTGKVFVDIHGITPEEEEMLGNVHLRARYEAVERDVLQGARCCICVSKAMAEHYAEKYPSLGPRWLTIPVIASLSAPPETGGGPSPGGHHPSVLYSGGIQEWQNLDAMLALAESAGGKIEFRFLSHDHVLIQRRIENLAMTHPPSAGYFRKAELPAAYGAADFGLILRDESPVNRVSCPTKLVEYLLFGLVPVVRSPQMGDFHELGFAYVTEDEFRDGFIPDSASRDWMADQNLHVVSQLTEQFHAGVRELRAMMSAGPIRGEAPAGEVAHDERIRPPKTRSPASLGEHDPRYYLNLARAECRGYLARKPAWATRDQGVLSLNYTMGLVKHFKPRSMLEIGVSAGLTSGAMLVASHTYDERAKVYGIDVADNVYYAQEKKIGALVDEAYPELRPRLDLLLGRTCVDVPELFEGPLDFVYIDSLHSHPWPVLDALNSLTRLDEGGIIAMDGIRFGAPGHNGSAYFYHHYQGDKQTCDGSQTGAVSVHDRQALFRHCCEVLELGWEVNVETDVLKRTVANVNACFGAMAARRVRKICEARHEHLTRFERIYNVAQTIQWEYVEEMKRLAALDTGISPDAPKPKGSEPESSPGTSELFFDLGHFRRSVLDRHAGFPCRVLEVGALDAPTVDPSEADVKFLDYYSTEELQSMARKNGGDPASVTPVDYVCRTDSYNDVVSETFDVLIANHVLEHVDHAVRWLRMARTLIRDGGILFIVLPDKKNSFDRFRPDTPLSHLLFEHLAPAQDVSSIHHFETVLYYDRIYIGEENDPATRLDVEKLSKGIASSHPGIHRHVFQYETFAGKILKPLLYTGLVDFKLLEVTNCPQFGEFAVVLEAGTDGAPTDPGDIFSPATDSLPFC